MKFSADHIYALDFDGVICDSAVETGITGWKAATHVWNEMTGVLPDQVLLDAFRRVRPALETGYEAIIIMRLLYQGIHHDRLLDNYAKQIKTAIQNEHLNIEALKELFGKTRDTWIKNDLQEWIAMNPLFPEMAEKLEKLNTFATWYIVTTKQTRFVKQILQANKIELADACIFGLDQNMSKPEVLLSLLGKYPDQTICFVEDRLPTLETVIQHQQLQDIRLYLASWGYNTAQDRQAVTNRPMTLINTHQFLA